MSAKPKPTVPILRMLLTGAAGIALPILLHAALLPVLGEGSTPLFVVFLLSLLPATAAAFICAGEGVVRIGYAMAIVIGAAFVSLSLHEARILGAVPSLDAAAAPSRPAAAGFLLPAAAPRADLARELEVSVAVPRQPLRGASRGSTTLRGRFTVVPVVGADWTPSQPVPIVAVLDHGPDRGLAALDPAPWEAGRGVLRLLPDPLRDAAVRAALREAGWTAAPQIVVGRWVADPRSARLDAAMPLLWLFALAVLGLALVILSRHPWLGDRVGLAADGPGGSLPPGRAILQGAVALTLPSLVALGLRHAEAGPAVLMLAIGFGAVPSLMMTIGAWAGGTPVGVVIAGVILVVFVPLAVAARGVRPNGDLPSLAGARWADVQEASLVLAAGWLAWALLVVIARALAKPPDARTRG